MHQTTIEHPSERVTSEAEMLKAWRGRLGLSQAEAAKRLKVRLRTLEGWERGKRPPLRALWRQVERKLSGGRKKEAVCAASEEVGA